MKRTFSIGILLITFISTAGVAIVSRLPFHNNDFGGALAEAKQRHLPIFVEVWAPW